jgi:hypothetical protein
MSTGFTDDSGPLIVPALYKAGVISQPVFGWYLAGEDDESYLDIGILTDDSIREGEELIWIPVVENDYWWTNFITGVKIGTSEYKLNPRYALTDTGTSCAYIPAVLYDGIMSKVLSSVKVVAYDDWGYPLINCSESYKLPVIEFLYGGYWMQMVPEDYVLIDSAVSVGRVMQYRCGLCIDNSRDDTWLLGDAFLRGFYSVHDHKNKRFGFAPHTLSTKDAPYHAEFNETSQALEPKSEASLSSKFSLT